MATFTVVAIAKERSLDGTHQHLAGVWTSDDQYYVRSLVANSIAAGNIWRTSHNGLSAIIHTLRYCPQQGCTANPYLETNRDSTKADNIENLPLR